MFSDAMVALQHTRDSKYLSPPPVYILIRGSRDETGRGNPSDREYAAVVQID